METGFDIGLLDVRQADFYKTPGGFTGLRYKGEDYPHIVLRRCLPLEEPLDYISVAYPVEKDKYEEVGILKAVDDLSQPQQEIVMEELDSRYYTPEVLEIVSVQDKLGYVWIKMRLKNKKGVEFVKDCFIKDVSRNIRMLSDSSVIFFDVDGNRYVVDDLSKLSQQSVRRIEAYLF